MEKTDLDNHLKLDNRSPYDGEIIEAVPHAFAQEILKFIKLLPITQTDRFSEADQKEKAPQTALVTPFTQHEKVSKIAQNVLMAQKAISKMNERKRRQEWSSYSEQMEQYKKSLDEKIKKGIEEFKKFQESHNKAINEEISALEQTHKSTVGNLKSLIGDLSQRLKSANDLLVFCQNRISAQQREIDDLRYKYHQKAWELENKDEGGKCIIS